MTYRPAIGPGLGLPVSDAPTVTCDGCGAVMRAIGRHGPPAWFRAGRSPPGWTMRRGDDLRARVDFCPRCK